MSSPASSTEKLPARPAQTATRRPWYRRKAIVVPLLLLLAACIAVAVAVPLVLRRDRRSTFSDEELYFPSDSSSGVYGGRRTNQTYDTLIVTGSSYSDNAHPRPANLQGSIAGNGYWRGHWSNGRIWVEYLQDLLNIETQANYAYGGATIQRNLSPYGPPVVGEQVTAYLSELANNASSDPSMYQRKALLASFTTTNDINSVWRNYLDATNPAHLDMSVALSTISDSARLLISDLSRLIPARNRTAPDFLILPILPVELTPQSRQLARDANTTTDSIAQITTRYNEVLLAGARNLSQTLGDRGNVFTYDVTAWFRAMANDTSRYGVRTLAQGCSQVGCSNAKRYVFWDHLHLVTSMQERLAKSCAQVILHSNTTL